MMKIPEGWQPGQLGDFITLQRGIDITQKVMVEGEIPVISSSGITGYHNLAMAQGPGVITGRKGLLGKVYYIESDYWPHDTTLWVRDFKGNHPRFVYYFLKTLDFLNMDVGSSNPTLNRNHVHPIKVVFPSIEEQRAIASILGSLDDKIENNRRMNATLEATARALFQSWFVDFDPVHARAEGRIVEGMDAETAALFPDGFEESELGVIPMGWNVKPIGDVVKVVGGSTPGTTRLEFWEGGTIHWATPKDLSKLSTMPLLDTDRKITEQGLQQISSGLLPIGTILLSSRAPVGYLVVAEISVAINQGFIAMICNGDMSNLYIFFWTEKNMDVIKSRASGTTFQEISKSNFRPILAVVPSADILKVFHQAVEPLYARIVSNLREEQSLSEMRDLLLPKLMSGQVRVEDIEEAIK